MKKDKDHEYPETELLSWARFINAEDREEFEMLSKENEYLERAYKKLDVISADEEKRLEYEAREKAIRDYNHQMWSNWRQGHEAGEKSGYEKGEKSGYEKGRRESGIEYILDILRELDDIPAELEETIRAQEDPDVLKKWVLLASQSASIEEFKKKLTA